MRKTIVILIASLILSGCSGPKSRNSWQKKADYVQRRDIYYNNFVASGGMLKDESGDQVNPVKKEIQTALKQGRVINQER